MSSKTEQKRTISSNTVIIPAGRAMLLILFIIFGLFAASETADAQVAKILTFTDKKVYKEWYTDLGKTSGNSMIFKEQETDDLVIVVYAILLDQDGNIVYGAEGGLTGTIDDVKRLDHFHSGDSSTHHKLADSAPNFLTTNTVLKFVDDGSVNGDAAADGVYTAFQDIDDPPGNVLLDDHLLVNVTVTYGSLNEVYQVLIANQNCHQGQTETHGTHTSGTDGGGMDPCTLCHIGYEHMYENKSGTYNALDVHFGKMRPPNVTYASRDVSFIWNRSTIDRLTYSQASGWEKGYPGSTYCYACHYESGGTGVLYDYNSGLGDRSDLGDRPSCNVASKTLGAGTVTCHASTNITGSSIPSWSPSGAVGNGTSNYNVTMAKSHAYDPYGTWNVPCAGCHDTSHSLIMPKKLPSNYSDISEQCESCHAAFGKHNNSINCIQCHGNDQHNISYLQKDTTFKWNDTNSAQCSDCHENITFAQKIGVNPVIVPPTKHSADNESGQKWGAFWTSEEQKDAAGGSNLINWSQKPISSETTINSTTSGYTFAQIVDDIFEELMEGWKVVPPIDNYTYATSNTPNLGTVYNFSFMQNASDGKNATLREGNQTVIIVKPNATLGDTTTDTLSGIINDDSATEDPDTLSAVGTTDNVYTVDAAKIMKIDKFNTSKIPGGATITGVILHLEYGIEDGYTGTNPFRWARQGGALNSTGIIPDDLAFVGWSGDTTYDLYSQGIDTVSELNDLDVEFTNNDGGGADAVHLDYAWLEVRYTGGAPQYYEMDIVANVEVPYADKSFLEIRYYRDANDTYDLFVYNGTAWNDRGNLSNTSMSVLNYTLTNEEYNNGNRENNNGHVKIRFTDRNQTPVGTSRGNLYMDYLRVHYLLGNTSHYEFDVRHNMTELSTEKNTDYYFVIRGYMGSGDNANIKMWDYEHGDWRTYGLSKFKQTTDWYNVSISSTSVDPTGKAIIRYTDDNQSRLDNTKDSIFIDYSGIRSETYDFLPCRYCHAVNKHAADAMGNVHNVKGSNKQNTTDFVNSTWCANCHLNVSNPGYNVTGLAPAPPLITIDNTGKTGWYDHTPYVASGFNDSICNGCHGNGSFNSKQNVHDITVGKGGGKNCTACHNEIDGSAAGMLVNFSSVNRSMHANLNKNAAGNDTNKPCWGCHGTLNGAWANETDQPGTGHNETYKVSARKCHDCHNDSNPLFLAKPVTDHIPSGLSITTDVKTSKYNYTYCAFCHNNSIGSSSDPDDLGTNPMNASAAHYGANRTKGILMSPGSNSTDCVFCHKNTSNMAKWGVNSSSNANISKKTNHNLYLTNDQCGPCHGGYSITAGFTFHNTSLGKGVSGGKNCTACHNISSPGTYSKVDFVAINNSIHGNLNKQASASQGNITNKPCWGCHGAKNGPYANESDQPENDHNTTFYNNPRKCEDCHINGSIQFNAPGLTEHIMPGKNAFTEINVTEGYCTVCHNNSITMNSDNDGLGLMGGSVINASSAHYARDANTNLMAAAQHSDNCTYCHFISNGSAAWLSPRKPLTSTHNGQSNATLPSTCWGCHVDSRAEPATFHTQEINKGTGSGPNCRNCHNVSDIDPNKAHIDADVFNASIHGGMNTTIGVDINEPCWGCHGNGSSEGHNTTGINGKGTYKNPYNCTDCHISTGVRYAWASSRNALTVAEHYAKGNDIRASYNSTTVYSCLKCHQGVEELRFSNSDPDNNRTTWTSGGDTYDNIGGNYSPYHYGKKRSDLRSGSNASCIYCHQNSSSVFPLTSTNLSIYEHTNTGGRNTSGPGCTSNLCHASGYIHNSSLSKPMVQVWTGGKADYCAPCHKTTGSGSNLKVNNSYHNTTTGDITDCGYCHNSEAMKSSAPQRVHSGNLTRGGNSTFNNCYNCHQNGFTSKVIFEHTNSSYANITNSSMTCDKNGCHYSNRTHSKLLAKPAANAWTADGNDYCLPCHNSSDSMNNATKKIYNKGHDPANRTTDTIRSCGNCHNASSLGAIPVSFRLHDPSSTNLSGSNDFTCEGCHNGTAVYVGIAKQIFSHMPDAANYRGNTSESDYDCKSCHNLSNKPSMHSAGMNRSNGTCDTCHFNRTSPFKANKKMILTNDYNHTYSGQNSCNITQCHNASGAALGFHLDKYAAGIVADPERVNVVWNDRNNFGFPSTPYSPNVDCIDCHGVHNNTYPFINSISFEPVSGDNKKNHSLADNIDSCYNCHTNRTDATDRYMLHNVTIEPLLGGPACIKCHNKSAPDAAGYPAATKRVNHTALNLSIHRNLVNYTAWNDSKRPNSVLLDSACWTCHATNIVEIPNNAHPDRGGPSSQRPLQCIECHPESSNISDTNPQVYQNATKIFKHYKGAIFGGGTSTWSFNTSKECYECHMNSLVPNTNITYAQNFLYGNEANISHYGNRSGLLETNETDTGCKLCHSTYIGLDYGNAVQIPSNHSLKGSKDAACQEACHNSDNTVNITLHEQEMGVFMGTAVCFSTGCHSPSPTPTPGGPRR